MTIAALRALLDEELPHVPRHPAPRFPHRHFTAKETPTMQPTARPSAPQPTQDTPTPLPIGKLLAWGDQHPDTDIQNQAARARAALTGLRQRYATDQELAAITTEAEQLQQRLAELRARQAELEPPKARRRRGTAVDYDSATVRAWARDNGVDCPAVGRPPKRVVDAWRAATAA